MFLTYLRCPDQALARHAGAYPDDSRSSFRGGLAHRIFARHLNGGPIEDSGFEQACREEIGQGLNPKVGALGLRPSELAGVISEVGELYARFKRIDMQDYRAAEVFLETEPAKGVVLRGTIDAVFEGDGGVRLVDWKTGELGQSQDQLWFYAALWALINEAVPAQVEAMSVATGERWEASPDESKVRETLATVAGLVADLRSGIASGATLERRPGPWCRFCPVLADCADGQGAVAVFRAG